MATMNITEPRIASLNDLLTGRLFEIPTFQRPYSWKTAQREELFSDIDKLLEDDNRGDHFMGMVVCLDTNTKEIDGTDEYAKMQIVDGQQRLTTLVILLKAIQIVLKKNQEKDEATKLQSILVRGQQLVLLQTNHQSRQMFRSYLVSSKIPDPNNQKTAAERAVANAIKECIKYAQNKADNQELKTLLIKMKQGLKFILYTINDEKSVYTVFEVLNSRGLPVASIDKCKSLLMGIVYDRYSNPADRNAVINSLHDEWSSIYSTIGTHKISDSELLRFAATLCYFKSFSDSAKKYGISTLGKAMSEEESLKYFETIAKSTDRSKDFPSSLVDTEEDICLLISRVIKQVSERLSAFEDDSERNKDVTNITQARLLSTAIGLSSYNDNEKKILNALWEKITFKIYGLFGKDSRTCVGAYVRLARDIYHGRTFQKAKEDLEDIGKGYQIEKAVKELKGMSWYTDYKDEAKYVLYRYEESLAKGKIAKRKWAEIWNDTAANTIEHIYPETFSATLQKNWPNPDISSQDDLDKIVHNIGNLTLLPHELNSSLGQKPFVDKKEEYKKYSLKITEGVVEKTNWTKTEILEREDEILKFIATEWA